MVEILRDYGFRINAKKQGFGRLTEGGRVTKLRINQGRLDISPEYLGRVNQQLQDASMLASGARGSGVYFTPAQIFGRIQFIGWVNYSRSGPLMQTYNSIDWSKVEAEAVLQGLVASRKILKKRSAIAYSSQGVI